MSGGDRVRILVARIVEMYELFQSLNVAVVEKTLLEVGPGSFGRRTLRRCQRHVARRSSLHLAVDSWRVLRPTPVRVRARTESAPEESPESQISVSEAVRIRSEPVGIRLGLIVESIPGIQW